MSALGDKGTNLDHWLARLRPQLRDAAAGWPACELSDVEAARVADAAQVAEVGPADFPGLDTEAVAVFDTTIPRGDEDGEFAARVYRPRGAPSTPGALLFLHGGAFCLGDLETDHLRCWWYAQQAQVVVVSVDYALAPEHPFPAGLKDAWTALSWVRANAGELGTDPARIGVGGESAGAGLAAGMLLDRATTHADVSDVVCQMLLFPALDRHQQTASMAAFTDTPAWDARQSDVMWRYYLGRETSAERRHHADPPSEAVPDGPTCRAGASPLCAPDLAGSPPTLVQTAEIDPLRDEGLQYAVRLLDAGVPTEIQNFAGTFHVFDLAAPDAAVSQEALRSQVCFLRAHLG